jgi:hypothetical protein
MVRWTGRAVAMLLVVVLATVVVSAGSAASNSETSQPVPVVLALMFRPVVREANGVCGQAVLTSGRCALVSRSSPGRYTCATSYVLIDDRTGKRTVIHKSSFTGAQAFGAPWIFFQTTSGDVLYNIATKKTRRCDASQCQPNGAISYSLGSRCAPAGAARWISGLLRQLCGRDRRRALRQKLASRTVWHKPPDPDRHVLPSTALLRESPR